MLIARALAPRRAVVVHPQFTEPEAALRAAGHPVERLRARPDGYARPGAVPDDADLVVLGNPTNPTSVLHPAATSAALPGPAGCSWSTRRSPTASPGEAESLAGATAGRARRPQPDQDLGPRRPARRLRARPSADLIAALAAAQPHWAVSAPALAACVACSSEPARAEVEAWTHGLAADRTFLTDGLHHLPGVSVAGPAAASFVLVRLDRPRSWEPLRDKGFAVRRADTFPGLDEHWIRVAVRDTTTSTTFLDALKECL